jgi:hypothetical protein
MNKTRNKSKIIRKEYALRTAARKARDGGHPRWGARFCLMDEKENPGGDMVGKAGVD